MNLYSVDYFLYSTGSTITTSSNIWPWAYTFGNGIDIDIILSPSFVSF
jgi:hypothetical protein